MGFPIGVLNPANIFHVLICTNTVYIAFRGAVISAMNYSSYFGSKITCKSATILQNFVSASDPYLNANFVYFVGFTNGNVYKLTVNAAFKFNLTVN
jgi:hypothetical protein